MHSTILLNQHFCKRACALASYLGVRDESRGRPDLSHLVGELLKGVYHLVTVELDVCLVVGPWINLEFFHFTKSAE